MLIYFNSWSEVLDCVARHVGDHYNKFVINQFPDGRIRIEMIHVDYPEDFPFDPVVEKSNQTIIDHQYTIY